MGKHRKGGASERLIAWAVGFSRPAKRLIMLTADGAMIPLALATAIWLKLGPAFSGIGTSPWLYVAALAVSIPIFAKLGLYRAVVRFLGSRASKAVFVGVTASVLMLAMINELLLENPLPLSALAIYWALALLYVGGSRLLARQLLIQRPRESERVVIFGAGEAGARLAASLHAGRDFLPIGFIDDNRALWGSVIHGVEVYRPGPAVGPRRYLLRPARAARHAFGEPPATPRDPGLARAAGRARADRAGHRRHRRRPGARRGHS